MCGGDAAKRSHLILIIDLPVSFPKMRAEAYSERPDTRASLAHQDSPI